MYSSSMGTQLDPVFCILGGFMIVTILILHFDLKNYFIVDFTFGPDLAQAGIWDLIESCNLLKC